MGGRRSRTAVSAGLILVAAGCGMLPPPEARPVDVEIEPELGIEVAGEVVEVWSSEIEGATWRLVAFRTADGDLCLFEALEGSTHHGGTCGPARVMPGAAMSGGFGTSAIAEDEFLLTYGLVGPVVEEARVEAASEAIEASVVSLRRIGAELGVFVALVPAGRDPISIQLRDGAGEVLVEFETGQMP